jgi:hypothetical protein
MRGGSAPITAGLALSDRCRRRSNLYRLELPSLIQTRRGATNREIAQIIDRIANAPFETIPVHVPRALRLPYEGRILGSREPSFVAHHVKRTLAEAQWSAGTSSIEYLAALRRAAQAPDARLLVYTRQQESCAATLTSTEQIVPRERLGVGALPHLLVVYSADRGVIITGYMVSSVATINLPEEVLWLR